jgi:hypothetical protein
MKSPNIAMTTAGKKTKTPTNNPSSGPEESLRKDATIQEISAVRHNHGEWDQQ